MAWAGVGGAAGADSRGEARRAAALNSAITAERLVRVCPEEPVARANVDDLRPRNNKRLGQNWGAGIHRLLNQASRMQG